MAGEPLTALLASGEPAGPAIVVPDSGQVLSYGRLADGVGQLVQRLAGLGVRRGDRVALALPNGPDVLVVLLAVVALGATAAPLNPAYTQSEFEFFLADIGPKLLLIPASGAASASAAAAVTGVPVTGVTPSEDGIPSLAGEDARSRSLEPGGPDDVALILHTSGTTSRPKQVPLLQRNVMASARTIAAHYRLGTGDVSFCVMPLFHIHGLVASTFAALAGGGAVLAPRRFTPRRFWPQAREYGATWLSAGPTLHRMILDAADQDGPPATLRFVRSCSSALPEALLLRAEREYGVPMLEAYGMTEASHQMTANPLPPAARIPGSVGVPTGTDVRIVDKDGNDVPDGGAGQVIIRGPGLTPGYVANPAANEEAFSGGWFRTGDLGMLRDGYLYLQGRLKEMIIRGGENISPAEIEEALLSHAAVRDAACFGVPDAKYGELVGAAVALERDVTPRELTEHCRQRLAAFKVPATITVLDEIPRTPTGKPQRRKAAELAAGLAQSDGRAPRLDGRAPRPDGRA
jgi:oxalate---CoA ligase